MTAADDKPDPSGRRRAAEPEPAAPARRPAPTEPPLPLDGPVPKAEPAPAAEEPGPATPPPAVPQAATPPRKPAPKPPTRRRWRRPPGFRFALFAVTLAILCGFAWLMARWPGSVIVTLNDAKAWVIENLRAWYVIAASGFVVAALWLMAGRVGDVRLGRPGERPAFGFWSWLAMMLAVGTAAGLAVWAVAEPLYHFQANPFIAQSDLETEEAVRPALRLTLLHWAIHPWALFCVTGVAIAAAARRWRLPARPSTALVPLIGWRVRGPAGLAIDAVLLTGGLAVILAAVALGLLQAEASLAPFTGHHTGGALIGTALGAARAAAQHAGLPSRAAFEAFVLARLPLPVSVLIGVGLATAITLVVVATGLRRGARWLALAALAAVILIGIAIAAFGPTRFLLSMAVQTIGDYLAHLPELAFNTGIGAEDSRWQGWWTLWYWGAWIAMAPLAGTLIARISTGRSVRELAAGAFIVTAFLTIIWVSVYGGATLQTELFGKGSLIPVLKADPGAVLTALARTMKLELFREPADWARVGAPYLAPVLIILTLLAAMAAWSHALHSFFADDRRLQRPWLWLAAWPLLIGGAVGMFWAVGNLPAFNALRTLGFVLAAPASLLLIAMLFGLRRSLRRHRG
jgi:choline/glycine/proline betaine transport protein